MATNDKGEAKSNSSNATAVATCSHVGCNCQTTEGEFCNEFCEQVETSDDMQLCGCGHFACDASKELGNEGTFSQTGS